MGEVQSSGSQMILSRRNVLKLKAPSAPERKHAIITFFRGGGLSLSIQKENIAQKRRREKGDDYFFRSEDSTLQIDLEVE